MSQNFIISAQPNQVTLHSAGIQGPEGIQGISADGFFIQAPTPFGAQRLLALTDTGLAYADHTDLSHVGKVIGFTTAAVEAGSLVKIRSVGELNGFSGLLPGMPIYLGSNGVITQTPVTSGIQQQVGVANTSNSIIIQIFLPITLG